jgi:NAD(P)-dependent dehydrogenase (short-subunit alcohol dehydrogenase family)
VLRGNMIESTPRMDMDIAGRTVLVTGANRGLGKALVGEFVERGAAKVYAGARDTGSVQDHGRVVPLELDLLDPASIERAARTASDVTILVNNAGIDSRSSVLDSPIESIRADFDTNTFGTLAVARAFVPVLERNGGGSILNILSVLSWFALPQHGGYCAAKAASWSLTNSLRQELAGRGIHVSALHVAYMDTDMARGVDAGKIGPESVAAVAVTAIADGDTEILVDDTSRQVKTALAAPLEALYGEA